jgi:hypothetical protein
MYSFWNLIHFGPDKKPGMTFFEYLFLYQIFSYKFKQFVTFNEPLAKKDL